MGNQAWALFLGSWKRQTFISPAKYTKAQDVTYNIYKHRKI